ncbi:ABC transporter permease [Aminipila sp.]|uniref:ABC transporter permease n=1 Tax=Aminipila sp. TaxID=2060095 RepID=UPI00289A4061|nr:ABC transporter permease [Aminipila sp.]
MLIIENLFLAIAGLKTNKMRSLLTMLGIIIGISSVIAIVSVGDSISASIEKDMKEMGMENISVDIRRKTDDTQVYYDDDEKPQAEDLLSLNDLKNFQDKFKDKIKTLSFTQDGGSGEVRVGKKPENVYIQGTNSGYSVQKKVKVINGRYLEDKDVERARKVAVIPRELADNIEKQGDEPLGSEIKVFVQDKLTTFLVIGIYDNGSKNKGVMAGGFEELATIYVPATTAGELKNETNFRGFEVSPAYGVSGESLLKDINSYFGDIYSKNKKWECVGYNMQQDMNSYTDMLNKVKMSIAVIAGISLLVGGIGVMNIMLVSVTERTREIGIRKALGAKGKFIRLQFIVEAIIICGIGGMIGVALGLGISGIVVSVMGNALQISLPVIFISVAFSMSIGVFFGYYPANKAAKLDPIEALRYE